MSPSVSKTSETRHVFVVSITASPSAPLNQGAHGTRWKKRRIARTFSRFHLSADTIWFKYRGCHSDRAPRWCEPLRLQYAWNEVIRCVIPPQRVFRPLGFIPLPPRATGWIHSETVVQLLLYNSCLSSVLKLDFSQVKSQLFCAPVELHIVQ